MKFNVGDKVCYKHPNPNDNVEVGEIGTICGISEVTGNYGVAFETKDTYKHNCNGLCRDNYGWWCAENTLEPADSKILRMADGTIIGEFNTGGVVSIHDLPISEWYNPVRFDLPEFVFDAERAKELAERLNKELAGRFNAFPNNGISAKNGGKNSMKFTFYVKEGTRIDKSCNKTVPTMTTFVSIGRYHSGKATCDKADYDERQGCLEAIANAFLDGNFDREFNKAVKKNERTELHNRTCTYCGKVCDTVEELKAHEAWHVERKKARRERYLLRKRAKEIAFEEQARKMAKEIIAEDNKK